MRMRYGCVAAILTLLFAGAALGLNTHAQADLPDCTTSRCTYLPIVERQAPPPTPTSTTPPLPQPTNTQPPAPTATNPPVTPTRDPDVCAAEYPTVCIPPPPPDLDCGDIPYRNFTALPPDRHNFDTDNDRIGCEQN